MKTYNLHLIRHGESEGSLKGQYIGRTDSKITTNGIIELQKLQKSNIYPKCGMVFSSPLSRAADSAKIIFPSQEIILNNNIREMDFGEFEGKTYEELKNNKEYTDWISGKLQSAPGGESNLDFATRLCIGIREIVQTMMDSDVYSAGVIMHGGAIMTLLSVSAVPRQKMAAWACRNGCGYTVRITPSLYQRSGILEVVSEIPKDKANIIANIYERQNDK